MTDSKNSSKSGRFAELLGSYDPRKSLEALKVERIKHWLAQGAGVTGTVNNLLIKKGIIRGKKIHVGMDNVVPAPKEEATPVEETAPVPEPVIEEAPVEEVAAPEPVVEAPAEEAKPVVE